jgi:hypothetical protein
VCARAGGTSHVGAGAWRKRRAWSADQHCIGRGVRGPNRPGGLFCQQGWRGGDDDRACPRPCPVPHPTKDPSFISVVVCVLLSLSQLASLSLTCVSYGIRAVTIAPGTFDTPLMGFLPDEQRKKLADATPFPPRLGRYRPPPHLFAQRLAHTTCPLTRGVWTQTGRVWEAGGAHRAEPDAQRRDHSTRWCPAHGRPVTRSLKHLANISARARAWCTMLAYTGLCFAGLSTQSHSPR